MGTGDHNILFYILTYVQVLKREQCKYVKGENGNRGVACDSSLIENGADINANLNIFNSYFNFCLDMLGPTRCLKMYPNNKLRVN